MKLSPQERADRRAAFRRMGLAEKLGYILAYYKLPLVLILIAAIAAGSVITRLATRKNELLYLALVNVSVGDDLTDSLTDGFVAAMGEDPGESEVYVYAGLYLSENPAEENHEYSYASRLKLLAAIDAEQLDVVLLNREAYDLLSRSGYLLDLHDLPGTEDAPPLSDAAAYLTENDVILDDNALEVRLGTADAYEAVTVTAVNAVEISSLPLFAPAGFSEPVYLGVIANSPRLPAAAAYIARILSPAPRS